MPTARGWLVAGAGIALWAASRGFGAAPLSQLGFGLVVLVIIAVVVVRVGRHDIVTARSITPERVAAGREVSVRLELHNRGRGAAPLLLLEDKVPSELTGRARFAIRGIEAKGARITTYSLRPSRRGHYSVGPLEVTVTDPFGVARIRSEIAGTARFLAYPRIEPLTLPKDSGTRRSMMTSARRQPTGSHGEDFYTLREYVEGDDLRRINWAATAKRNRFMIRQEETPWHARATILLDDRATAHSPSSWERSIEVAASLLDLYHRSGYAFRLVRAVGPTIGPSRGSDHFHRCLDALATVQLQDTDEGEPDPILRRLREMESQAAVEGVLIAVTGATDLDLGHSLIRCARRFRMVVTVLVPESRYRLTPSDPKGTGHAAMSTLLDRGGVRTTTLLPGDSLTNSWATLWRVWAPATVTPEGGDAQWDQKHELA